MMATTVMVRERLKLVLLKMPMIPVNMFIK